MSLVALSSAHHSCWFVLMSLQPLPLASQWLLPKASVSSAPREPTFGPTSHGQSHLGPQTIHMLAIHGRILSLASSTFSHMTSLIPPGLWVITIAHEEIRHHLDTSHQLLFIVGIQPYDKTLNLTRC